MKQSITKAWELYERGKELQQASGLYSTVRQNQRFYRGDQWQGSTEELPHPVFNIVRRITDYLVAAVAPQRLHLVYTDDRLPYTEDPALREQMARGLEILSRHADYRWQNDQMKNRVWEALLASALTGNGIFYCWWDGDQLRGESFQGDIRTDVIPSTDLFVADPSRRDIQSQDYVILSSRVSTQRLKEEARAAGLGPRDVDRILPDEDGDGATTTCLIRFWREKGEVMFERATRDLVIRRGATGMYRYPVASFCWQSDGTRFYGDAAVNDLIPNQKYINTAYAMAMKHMSDTAFSKVIYDKSRIPEWSNRVGEAIGAMGGGNVADAVSVVGVGRLQDRYLELIDSVIQNTKDMAGATDSALGDEIAQNTSAILALQQASRLSLCRVRADLYRCIGEVACIWADMLCAYSPAGRRLPIATSQGVRAETIPYALFQTQLLHASVEVEDVGNLSPSATVTVLDKLLTLGALTPKEYLILLPEGVLSNRESILRRLAEGEGGEDNA